MSEDVRADIMAACRVLNHFGMVRAFGHVSARLDSAGRMLITPRKALGLVALDELVELDPERRQLSGGGRPPLEAAMHLAVYQQRPDVTAICRAHPPAIAAYACAGEPIAIAHGFGANLGCLVPVFRQPFLVADPAIGRQVAETLADGDAVILQANGMLAVGESVPEACVKALFLEETAAAQLMARAAGLAVQSFSPETAARRRGMDHPNEPVRAWEWYLAAASGSS